MRRYFAYPSAVFVLLSLLTACGYQLRGTADLPFERVHVETGGFSLFAAELRRALESGRDVEVTDTPQQAQVVLKIIDEQRERNILSISSTGSVSEFALRYSVRYRIMDNQLQDLVAPSAINLRRDLTYDDTQTLGKESEQELLYRDMQTDAVQQMLRRLSLLSIPS
jgi:LPS-assembly lipoprotein